MSYNFGSNLGANTAQPGFGFGTPKTNAPTFGTLGATQTQPSGSITFGTPIATAASSQQNTGLSFGTPTLGTGLTFATPASSANTGFAFGTPAKTTGLTFGTPTTQTGLNLGINTTQTGLNFGTPTTTTLNFGSTSAPPTGLTFGTPNTSTATPTLNFGAPATTTGLSFGTPATSGGLGFGVPTANTSFTLGGTTTTTSTANPLGGINFGAPASTTLGGGLNFGTPTSTTLGGGLNFGTPTSTTLGGGLNFGTPTSTTLGGGLNFGTPSSNPNPLGGISFGTPASSSGFTLGSGTATTGLSFGTATTSTGLNFGLGGAATTTTPALNFKSPFTPASSAPGLNFGFNAPKTTTTPLTLGSSTTTPVGLGGVDSSQLKTGIVATGRTDTVAAKESQVPNEIIQSIENFKQFVKDQKAHSSDVSRGSARPFVKVKEDIDLISTILTDVGNDMQRNQQQADKLKYDSAKCLHNAEMAQRTNDTPPGLQFENNAPLRYFIELVNQFEQDLQALRVQIDVTDKHFQSLHEPKFLTSQELATGMRRLHDTFVALAGRLHSVHTQVESQKEQYLNLRKYILKDPTNIFLKPVSKEEQALDVALKGLAANKSVSGPTPFSSFNSPFGLNMIQAQQNAVKPPPAYPATSTVLNFAGSSGSNLLSSATSQLGTNTNLFGNTSLQQQTENNFQLQNPPPGNKRGKR